MIGVGAASYRAEERCKALIPARCACILQLLDTLYVNNRNVLVQP